MRFPAAPDQFLDELLHSLGQLDCQGQILSEKKPAVVNWCTCLKKCKDMGRKFDLAYCWGCIWIFTILWLGSGLSLVICCICSIVNSASVPVHGKCAEKCFKTLTLLVEDHVSWLSWVPRMDFWLSIAFPYCWQTNNILNYPTRCAQYPQLSVLFLQPALSRVALVVAHLVNEHMAGVIVEQPYQCKIDFITPAFSSISKCHFPEVAVPSNSQQILHHFFHRRLRLYRKLAMKPRSWLIQCRA